MRYTILGFLWAVALIAYIQRSAISVPLQEIGKDLCVVDADQALGFLVSAWYFGYAIFQLPAGRFADTIGGRRALVLLTVLWSLATAIAGFARNYWELVAVWTLMGALQAGVFTDSAALHHYATQHLEVGGIILNDIPTFRADNMPYGGVKGSGLGREGVRFAMEDFCERRTVVTRNQGFRAQWNVKPG